MLVKILHKGYENATFSTKKCEVYFSYLKLGDAEVTDNTNSSCLWPWRCGYDCISVRFKETVRRSTAVYYEPLSLHISTYLFLSLCISSFCTSFFTKPFVSFHLQHHKRDFKV